MCVVFQKQGSKVGDQKQGCKEEIPDGGKRCCVLLCFQKQKKYQIESREFRPDAFLCFQKGIVVFSKAGIRLRRVLCFQKQGIRKGRHQPMLWDFIIYHNMGRITFSWCWVPQCFYHDSHALLDSVVALTQTREESAIFYGQLWLPL